MAKKKNTKKKKKSFVKFLKILGICTASVIGFVGLSIGIFALFGGFKEKVVSLTGMNFEQVAYVLDGNSKITNNENPEKNGVFDTSIKLVPLNEDATKLDVLLSGENNIVTLPTGSGSRVGKNLNIKLETLVDDSGIYNKGGEFTLTALQEEDLLTTSTKVFVESRINSFNLSTSVDNNSIYPGTKFKVEAQNFLPSNSLEAPVSNEFRTYFGQNYFKKTPLYFSSNESVATVNILTGEVEVLSEGSFYIYAYVPTTYKNNANLPKREDFNTDAEYFSALEDIASDGQALTIKRETASFASKPISVTGITASANSYNLYVNQTYKYAVDGSYASSDKQIDLSFNLLAPENSNYTSSQLNYKLQDIQLFEGYKTADGSFCISANQYYNEKGILQSSYFDISQNKNPLYYTITPIDHTSTKDLYLVARISNEKLEAVDTEILCENKAIDNNGDYVYYAYVKVNTNIIANESINLSTNKVLGSFTLLNESNYLISGSEILNLSDLISSVLPENSTYNLQKNEDGSFKYVKFYVENNKDGVIETSPENNGTKEEIPYVPLEEKIAENVQTITNGGYFVKALKEGTVKLYVAIGKQGRTDDTFEELFASGYVTLVVTQTITFSEFTIDAEIDEISNSYNLVKGNTINITFKTDNVEGFLDAYQEGFFTVNASSSEKVLTNVDLPSDDGIIKVTITAINEGNTKLNILFNGINLTYVDENSHLVEFEGFDINIKDDALTSITIISTEINQNNQLNFAVNPESADLQFKTEAGTIVDETNPLVMIVEMVGGNNNTMLAINNLGNEVTIKNAVTIKIAKDGENENTFKLTITPLKLCENVQFYISSSLSSVISQVVTINIKADYQIIANYNNSIVMNSNTYEQVIGGKAFTVQPAANSSAFLTYQTSTGKSYEPNLFDVIGDGELYTNNSFDNVAVPTPCQIKVKPVFTDDDEFEIFCFYIMPKIYITTTSLSVDTGLTISEQDLKDVITLNVRDYDINKKIVSTPIDAESKSIFSDKDFINQITNYSANAYEFDEKVVELYCKALYDNEEYTSVINVVVNSSIQIQNASDYLHNGEQIELSNLFKIWNTSTSERVSTTNMSVKFNQATLDFLTQKGIKFYNQDSIIENPRVNTTITKLVVPEDFNEYILSDLLATVSAEINGSIITKDNHEFDLSFKITDLQINETYVETTDSDKIIYLLSGDVVNYDNFKYFILSSTVSTIDEANVNVTPQITKENGEILFSLNKIVKRYTCVELEAFATKNSSTFYIGKAYSVTDLAILNLKSTYFTITSVSAESNSDYSIENNNLIIKTAGKYNIEFSVLGRKFTLEEYTFEDITLNEITTVHSNLSYELLDATTLNSLVEQEILTKFEILNEKDEVINNSYITIENKIQTINSDDYSIPTLIIGNYSGDKLVFKVRTTFFSENFTGASKTSDNITLYKFIVNQKFVETITDNNSIDREVILNKFNHTLANYFEVIKDDNDTETQITYFTIKDNDTNEIVIDPTKETEIAYENSMNFDLIVKVNDKEVKRIYFYANNYNIEAVSPQPSFYKGQILNKEDLLALIKLVDDNSVATSKYNDIIKFYDKNETEITTTNTLTLTDTNTTITVYLSQSFNTKITITVSEIAWAPKLPSGNVIYNDTKIYNYISAKIGETQLVLYYRPCTQEEGCACSVTNSVLENNIYSLYSGANLIAKLNALTGELSVEDNVTAGQTIAVIPYVASSKVEYGSPIIFTIKTISTKQTEEQKMLDIYVGDNTTSLTQCGGFEGAPKDIAELKFEIVSLTYDQTLGNYTYHLNNNLNRYEILKNGAIVAYLSGSNFTCTSLMDSMTIKVEGYLYINTTDGYTIESLGNIILPVTLNIQSINITLPYEQTIEADGKTYIVVDTAKVSEYKLEPTENGERRYFTNLQYQSAFVARVTNSGGLYTFESKLLNLTPQKSSTSGTDFKTELSLPNGYSLNIGSSDTTENINKEFNITWSQSVVDYIFVTLEYNYGSYTNTINVVFIPENSILFEYASVDSAYANVVSPAEYVFSTTGGLLFSMDTELLNEGSVLIKACKTDDDFTKDNSTNNNYTTNFNSTRYKYNIAYTDAENKTNLSISTNENASDDCNTFVIKIDLGDNGEYIYKICIESVDVKILDAENEINDSNPILIAGENEINLKDYIYINSIKITNTSAVNYETIQTHVQNIIFNEIINAYYKISSDGVFTPLGTIVDKLDILFTLYGKTHAISLQGIDTTIQFGGSYNLVSGQTYYLYITQDETSESSTIINAEIKTSKLESVTALAGNLSLSNFVYTQAGTTYNDSYFTSTTASDVTTFKFGGITFVQLIKNATFYEIIISNNISGSLTFDLNVQYSSKVQSKQASVANEDIIVGYIEPSIINGQTYQNMLSNETLTLSNFVSGFTGEATYSLSELSTKASISNGILTPTGDIHNDVYLEIIVKVNNLTSKFYVRIIPQIKYEIANTYKEFYVLAGETINLTKYAKVYEFNGFDALNEPIYTQLFDYTNTNFTEETTDDEIIANPSAYKVLEETQIKINNLVLTFKVDTTLANSSNVLAIGVDDRTTDQGLTLNLKQKVQELINSSSLTFSNATTEFSDTNGFISIDGLFLANTAGEYEVVVYINGVKFTLVVIVNRVEIAVTYTSAIAKEENNVLVKYQNIYATQTLNTTEIIEVTKNRTLQFSLEVLSSSGYDITSLNVSSTQGTIELRNGNSELLFSINSNKILCYSTLKSEILLKVHLGVEDNVLVENELNIRLLPVTITATVEKSITTAVMVDNKYNLIKNIVTANTCAESNNINLNDKLKFNITQNTAQAELDADGQSIIFGTSSGEVILDIILGEDINNYISRTTKIIYTASGKAQTNAGTITLNSASGVISLPNENFAIEAIRDGYGCYYTYNIKTTDGVNKYEVINSDGQKVIEIDTRGNFTRYLSSAFGILVEAHGLNQTISAELLFSATTEWNVDYNADEIINKTTTENGVKLIELLSGEEINVTNFIADGSINADNLVNVTFREDASTQNIYIKAFNITTNSYGYFDVSNGDTTIRVYVKIYAYTISLTNVEDYIYTGAAVTATDSNNNIVTVINKNSTFKTEYLTTDTSINVNDYIQVSSDKLLKNNIEYKLKHVVVFDSTSKTYTYLEPNIVEEEGKPKLSDYCVFDISTHNLNLKVNGVYYVCVVASLNNEDKEIKLRVLAVQNKTQTSSLETEVGDVLDLSTLIKVVAPNEQGINLVATQENNLFQNLTFALSNVNKSYMVDNLVYILDEGNLVIDYFYNGEKLGTINVQSTLTTQTYYLYEGINYIEKFYSNTTSIGEITNVSSIVFDGVSQTIRTEVRDVVVENYTVQVKYYIVDNLLEISESGEIEYYNSNYATAQDASEKYIPQNNIGIFYISVIKSLSNGYKQEFYKLNNYDITYDSKNKASYFVNGIERIDLVRYSLVSYNGQMLQNSAITETTISANGITLNIFNGTISGSKTNADIVMNIKVYIQEDNKYFGEKFIIVSL